MEYFSAKGTCLLQRIKCCQMSLATLLINRRRHLSYFLPLLEKSLEENNPGRGRHINLCNLRWRGLLLLLVKLALLSPVEIF